VEPSEIMTVLLDLAREAELEVRNVRAAPGELGEPPPSSAVCRVRGAVWVVLSSADPVAIQLAVIAGALRDHAPQLIEGRFLPPAVRALLQPE
jgi:hypothetical protein